MISSSVMPPSGHWYAEVYNRMTTVCCYTSDINLYVSCVVYNMPKSRNAVVSKTDSCPFA